MTDKPNVESILFDAVKRIEAIKRELQEVKQTVVINHEPNFSLLEKEDLVLIGILEVVDNALHGLKWHFLSKLPEETRKKLE